MPDLVPDPWETSEDQFPATGSAAEKLRFLLNYAVLAPSTHNTQPWLFKMRGEEIELYGDRTRALPVVDPQDRELIMSCGAALFHLRLALRHFGYTGGVARFPNPETPDLLARVDLGGKVEESAEDRLLFEAILRRRTNRLPFKDRLVPDSLLSALEIAAQEEGALLQIVQGKEARNAVADLIAEGDRIQMADKNFRQELAAWIRPGHGASREGLPSSALGVSRLLGFATPIFALALRTFDMGKGIGARNRKLAAGSPVLAVIVTDDDTSSDWLMAGEALARVLLRARAEEVWASFLNQPIEVPGLRPRLSEILGATGFPQLLLRMGYGQVVSPTPRRPVSDVLLSPG